VLKILEQAGTRLAQQSSRSLGVLLAMWIVGVGALAFLWQLGSVGLVDETEPLFAEAARQMLVRHDWVTPYFNDLTRFDKPPLIYWLMAIVYQLLGVNEWAVRLPSALAAIGLLGVLGHALVTYGSLPARGVEVKPIQGWCTAVLATGMTAFCGEMLVWGRVGVSDMLLTGCMGCCLLCFFQGYACPTLQPSPQPQRQWRWYFAAHTFAALGILTKGPVGLVLPGLIVLVFLAWTGEWSVLRELRLGLGFLWIALLTVPWFVLVIQANGEAYINSFFGYHNLERFTQVVNQHSAPWYFYFLVVLAGFAPWSLYIPAAIGRLRLGQWRRWQETPRQEQLGLFAGFWFFGIFLFFTIAVTKLPSYVLPLMPAAAILVALFWQDCLLPSPRSPVLRLSPALWASVLLNTLSFFLLGGVALSATNWIGEAVYDPAMPEFPIALQESPLLLRCGLLFLGTGLVLVGLLVKRRYSWLGGANLASFVLLMLLVLLPALNLVDTHRQLPLRSLAQEMVNQRRPGEEILMLGIEKPSLVFYSHYPIFFARHDEVILKHLEEVVLPQAQPDTFLLLTHPDRPSGLGLEPPNYEVLSAAGAYELVRVPKAQFLR